TVGAAFDAKALARELVGRQLVACVNIVERIHSVYRWNGAIEEEGEQLLVMKTMASRVDDLQRELLALHPYEVPEFLVLPVTQGSEPYLAWLAASTTPPPTR
ncbi:MAG: divalent-cation tolerance protein CutA, partial [Thermoanaerobaculia bacterium]